MIVSSKVLHTFGTFCNMRMIWKTNWLLITYRPEDFSMTPKPIQSTNPIKPPDALVSETMEPMLPANDPAGHLHPCWCNARSYSCNARSCNLYAISPNDFYHSHWFCRTNSYAAHLLPRICGRICGEWDAGPEVKTTNAESLLQKLWDCLGFPERAEVIQS